jgi:DNA-binding transcriptional LysR family regulator
MFSDLVAEHVRRGELDIVLADHEDPPVPVHLLCPQGRLSVARVRSFVDFATPRLKSHFARIAKDLKPRQPSTRS